MNEPGTLAARLTPAAPAAHIQRVPWRWRVAEQLSAWLPVLLMALLALGTWWLVKNTPVSATERFAAPLRHEPDYTMEDFSVQRFTAQGSLRVQLEGERLRHYPDTSTIEVDGVRIHGLAPDGGIINASARRAIANDAASELQLMGGAHVVREVVNGAPPIEFRGEFLHLFLDTERVRSHLPVVVRRDATELRADSLAYDHAARVLQLKGRVRAVFAPDSSKGAAAFTQGVRP